MIFSHIVERFYLNDLKQFLESYLKFLKVGGAKSEKAKKIAIFFGRWCAKSNISVVVTDQF